MKITSLPLFTITTMALLAMAQGDAVCHTVNAVAVPTPIIETISVLTGTTNVICDLSCDGSVNVNSRLVVAGMIDSGTSTCGGSISSNIFEDLTLSYSANGNMNVVITCTCIGAGNPAPTPPASSCFSEQATVEQPGQAPTKMTDLKIGDMVLTANKKFEPVYAFAHNDATTDTEFLQIHTTSGKNKKPLEVTGQHLVYVQGKDAPVTAKSIKVGDSLTQSQAGHGQGGAALVTKIKTVQRQGIYAPLTQDGTLVVDGIASSCYVSLQPNGDPQTMELQGHSASIISHHHVAHMLMTLPRLVCTGGISPKLCQTYNNDGVAHFVQMAFDLSDWFHAQHWAVQGCLLAVYLAVLCPLYALELLFGAKLAAAMAVGGLVFMAFFRGNSAPAVDPTVDFEKEA